MHGLLALGKGNDLSTERTTLHAGGLAIFRISQSSTYRTLRFRASPPPIEIPRRSSSSEIRCGKRGENDSSEKSIESRSSHLIRSERACAKNRYNPPCHACSRGVCSDLAPRFTPHIVTLCLSQPPHPSPPICSRSLSFPLRTRRP